MITKHSLITIDAGMQSCSGKTRLQITLELKGEAKSWTTKVKTFRRNLTFLLLIFLSFLN